MRKLYCLKGKYQCRKCANLGYLTQRFRPEGRCLDMGMKIEKKLKNQGGSLSKRPVRMHCSTFKKLRKKYVVYDEKRFYAINKEIRIWYGSKSEEFIDYDYCLHVPSALYDVYDYKD